MFCAIQGRVLVARGFGTIFHGRARMRLLFDGAQIIFAALRLDHLGVAGIVLLQHDGFGLGQVCFIVDVVLTVCDFVVLCYLVEFGRGSCRGRSRRAVVAVVVASVGEDR